MVLFIADFVEKNRQTSAAFDKGYAKNPVIADLNS